LLPSRRLQNDPSARDPNQLAKLVVDLATGNAGPTPESSESAKGPAAVEPSRKGGLKGGPARAKKLTKKQRSESARKAALARWPTKD
jgi:hypothetical protein